jgi:hypothetical protein
VLSKTPPPLGVLPSGLSEDMWTAVRSTHVNALLVLGDATAEKVIEAIRIAGAPVTIWRPGSPLLLPPVAQTGTLIIDWHVRVPRLPECLDRWRA